MARGRPKMVYEKTGKAYREDRTLIKIIQGSQKNLNKSISIIHQDFEDNQCSLSDSLSPKQLDALHELWDKYMRLRKKMRNQLYACCLDNNMSMPLNIEEYDSRAWEKFLNSVFGVRLPDWEHLKDPKIYISLWGYWRSMNRDIIKEYINWGKQTCRISFVDNDGNENKISNIDKHIALTGANSVDQEFDVSMKRQIFNGALSLLKQDLSDKQKLLIAAKQKGLSQGKITSMLGINSKIYRENLDWIKNRLKKHIVALSKKLKYEARYEDFI